MSAQAIRTADELAAAAAAVLDGPAAREVENLRRHLAHLRAARPEDVPAIELQVHRSERIVAALIDEAEAKVRAAS